MRKGRACPGSLVLFAALLVLLIAPDFCSAENNATHGLKLTIPGHNGEVTVVAASPDGQFIASGGVDGWIRIWDITSGKELHAYGGNQEVSDLVFSPDGKRLLCAALDGDDNYVLQLWDLKGQKKVKTFKGDKNRINRIAYSPDTKFILSGNDDGLVLVRDSGDGDIVRRFANYGNGVMAVGWSPDGMNIVAGGGLNGDIVRWDAADVKSGQLFKGHSDRVKDVLYLANGRSVISAGKDGSVRFWHGATGQGASNFREWWWGEINDLAINGNNTYLAGATEKGGVVVWYAENGKLLDLFAGHRGKVVTVAFAPDGNSIISGGSDGAIKVWQTPGTGSPAAMYELAVAHDHGLGNIEEDREEAFKWYLRAAHLDYPKAMTRLAEMLVAENVVDYDLGSSLSWLEKAAGLGNVDAIYILGKMYVVGRGVAIDHDRAVELWAKAAELGHQDAKDQLAKITGEISLQQIDRNSIAWVEKTAAEGDVEAQYTLGRIYWHGGKGIDKSYTKAVKWFKKAAKQGHAEAQFYTAESYKTGQGSPQIAKSAMKWYLAAAGQGHAEAQYQAGIGFANGDGGESDLREAVRWLEESAGQGNLAAAYRLGIWYFLGKGVGQNYGKALELMKKAAQNGAGMPTFFLAYMYETGAGQQRDLKLANKFYAAAAGMGNIFAGQAVENSR